MAKAPRPNHVKTRLVPPLTPQEAAALNACFLRDVTENIRAATARAPIQGFVAYAPEGAETLFEGMLAHGTGLQLADGSLAMPQAVQGFGRALFHAAAALLAQGYGAVCLLNSDSPDLPTGFLVQAAQALARPGDRVVLGPADDGGYYLIGLKSPHAVLFQEITWSTDQVSVQTTAQAAKLGLETVTLPSWYDVDDAASLRRLVAALTLPHDVDPLPFAAPATREWLRQSGMAARLGAGASGTKAQNFL
jgi:rSAM/selenodomain-associated transferase 1